MATSTPKRRSPVRRRPQARGVVTRRRLLETAETCIGARGYEATTMAEIAERSGVGVGTVYHHFPDKRALLLALVDDWGDRLVMESRDDDFDAPYLGDDPRGAVRNMLAEQAEQLRRAGGFQLALMQLAETDPDVRRRLHRFRAVGRERIRDLLVRGQRLGRFRTDADPLAAAFLIQNAINTTATEIFVHDHAELSEETVLDEVTEMICRYILEEST